MKTRTLFLFLLSVPLLQTACKNRDPRCEAFPQGGPCDPINESWYYDADEGICKPFYYQCAGAEPFQTQQECISCDCD